MRFSGKYRLQDIVAKISFIYYQSGMWSHNPTVRRCTTRQANTCFIPMFKTKKEKKKVSISDDLTV